MIQCNILNVELSNLQFNKLKSGIKNNNEVTLKLLCNIFGDSNGGKHFSNKLLPTNMQVPRVRKAFANNFSANVNLSKTQLHKIGQSEGFLGRHLGQVLKT